MDLYLSKNADFMHTMPVIFTSLLAFANTVLPDLRLPSCYPALNTCVQRLRSSPMMHPFVSVNLAGAMVVKFVQAPAWEH